jgi:hypothetical protein
MLWQRRSLQWCVLWVLALAQSAAVVVDASSPVTGAFERIEPNGIAVGWARDMNSQNAPIAVHVYVDGPAGAGGTFVGTATANLSRSDRSPGFRFAIPTQYWDGRPHRVFIYGIAASGVAADNVVLAGSPQTFASQSSVVRLDNGVIGFGVEPRCGGTLVELTLHGRNLLNNADCTGRQVQAALYDGNATYDDCSGCRGNWGWDPVQGGDIHNFGSPVLEQSVTANSIYIKTRPNEWYPDNKGGGPGRPVPSDVIVEQTISFVPNYAHAVKVQYRITHIGSDTHATAVQEFPAVWVNREFDNFVTYSGTQPWTGDAVTVARLTPPGQPAPQRRVSERWAALVDRDGLGLMVFVPHQYPYAQGFQFDGAAGQYGFGANYFRPHVPFTFTPGSVLEGEVYLIAGDYRQARADLRSLHRSGAAWPDALPPYGTLDVPASNQTVSSVVQLAGWVFDNVDVARVEVLVDGTVVGTAAYGVSRPDVAGVFPYAPERIGFSYPLDTTALRDGRHRIVIRAVDRSGNVALLPDVSIVVANGSR